MARRGLVVLLLVVMLAAWGISTAVFAEDYPDWSKIAPQMDAQAHLDIGGPNGKNFVTSGELYNYVQAIGKKLGCKYKIYLVRNDAFNACATVSRIYIYTGLTKRCANASEVALAIGHEKIHIDHHHLEFAYGDQVRQARQLNMQIDMIKGKDNQKIAKGVAKIGLKLSSLHISRENEYDADLSGALMAKQAGYSVDSALNLFGKMGSGPKGTLGGWLASHPDPKDRKARIIAGLPKAIAKEAEVSSIARSASAAKEIDASRFGKMVSSGNFEGVAYRKLLKDGPVYIFAKGSGEMATEGKAVVIPADAKDAVFYMGNPKPGNAIGLRVTAWIGKERAIQLWNDPPESCGALAVQIPVSALVSGDQVEVGGIFSKAPIASRTSITIDTVNLFAFRSSWLHFRQ